METIVSVNIRFDNPKDGDHQWKHRRLHLAQILNDYYPMVIGTQEGREPQLRDLESLLKDYSLVDTNRTWLKERMYPCFFLRKDILAKDCGDIWLSQTPLNPGSKSFASAFPRLCTWLKLQFKEREFLLANCHLDHTQTSTRQKQIQVAINELAKKYTDQEIIFLGDFNEAPDQEVRKLLNQSPFPLYDPWEKLKKKHEVSHHNFGEYADYAERIDWILLDEKISSPEIFLDKSLNEKIYPSDHYPVICKIEL